MRYSLISLSKVQSTFNRFASTKTSANKRLPVLTLYTKDPCPLCDIAKEKISGYSERYQFETVDITASVNLEWWKLYKYDIPVFHFEGEFLMKHQACTEKLEAALQQYEQK